MDHEKLRERIIKDLKEHNLSVRKVEQLAGLGKGSLQNFLVARTKSPTLETLHALSEVLKCDLTELLGAVSDKYGEQNEENVNLEVFASVFNHIKQFLLTNKLSVKNKKFLDLFKTIYYFCLSKKTAALDVDFANWYLETEFEKKKPLPNLN